MAPSTEPRSYGVSRNCAWRPSASRTQGTSPNGRTSSIGPHGHSGTTNSHMATISRGTQRCNQRE